MAASIGKAVLAAISSIFFKLLTKEFFEFIVIYTFEKFAERTENKYDDDIASKIKDILDKPSESK